MYSKFIQWFLPSHDRTEKNDHNTPETHHASPPVILPSNQISSQPATSITPSPYLESKLLYLFDSCCREIILETDPQRIAVRESDMKAAQKIVHEYLGPTVLNLRISARYMLAEYTNKLVRWQLGQVGSPKDDALSPYHFSPEHWKRLQDEWNRLRDAVVQARPEYAHNDLLEHEFRAVTQLLHYQRTLAFFRCDLHKDNLLSVQDAMEKFESSWIGGYFMLEEDEEVQVLEPEQMVVPFSIQHVLEPVKRRRSDINECIQ
ncbi:hypothetical protein FisN_9Lh346 [Fistulifera solaris]|uniref:Uncharacterized protein n=1 Tax=Fistulifera solaris TaxID=1519565 RepID=A0A1Z5KL32_FISSO|nr:hypothetical protein FisN_9Lh346 [Fistulifera solaris]|eukprot:GAX27030.1 hypothetical protein FisN_9Lh346 [Fistulifera solaris]